MTARGVLNLITRLYQMVMDQQKVVEIQEDSVEFLHEANAVVDVDRFVGLAMQEKTKQLGTTRAVLDDLNTQLEEAIASWSRLAPCERHQKQLPWPQIPGYPPQEPATEKTPLRLSGNDSRFCAPKLADPTVGTRARYVHQWKSWQEAPKINNPSTLDLSQNSRWWMQEQDHYGLLQPNEQGQLENAARAAQFHRVHAPAQHQSFAQEVRNAQQRQSFQSSLPPNHRNARSCSEDFWLDEDYDPKFWMKNLRPGNIWTNAPRSRLPDEDNLSPRTRPLTLIAAANGGQSKFLPVTSSVGEMYPGREALQVGTSQTPNSRAGRQPSNSGSFGA